MAKKVPFALRVHKCLDFALYSPTMRYGDHTQARAKSTTSSRVRQKNGYSPSFEEIGEGLELNSLATVHKHITNLEKKGAAYAGLQSQPLYRSAAAQGQPQAGDERKHDHGAAADGAHRRRPAD